MDHLQKTKKKNTKIGDSQYIYQNELDKACFQHDMAYGDFKDLTRETDSDKILGDEAFDIAKNPKYDGYQCGLPSVDYIFFNKKTSGETVKNKNMSDQQLAKELHNYTNQLLENSRKEKYTHLL